MSETQDYTNLPNKLRPTSILEMAPTCKKLQSLHTQAQKGNLPKVTLLAGASGCGKSSVGRLLAMSLNCKAEQKPCGVCMDCRYTRSMWETGMDFNGSCIFVDAGAEGGVAGMREMIERVMSGRLNPSGKVAVLIEECHLIAGKTKELLLNPTENSPENVHWFLMTSAPETLPVALMRRVNKYEFTELSTGQAIRLVQEQYAKVTGKQLDASIAERLTGECGSPGFLMKALEEFLLDGENVENLPEISFTHSQLENPKEVDDRICRNFLISIELFKARTSAESDVTKLLASLRNDIMSREVRDYSGLRARILTTMGTMMERDKTLDPDRMQMYAKVIRRMSDLASGYYPGKSIHMRALFYADVIESIHEYCTTIHGDK